MLSKPRSVTRPNLEASACLCGFFRNRLHSIGVSVTDTTPEIRIATQIVTENSRKRRPSTPPMNSTGMNTAASESVIDTIVKPISRSEEHTSELQSQSNLVCRLLLEKKNTQPAAIAAHGTLTR